MIFCETCEIFKDIYFEEHLRTTSSKELKEVWHGSEHAFLARAQKQKRPWNST